MVGMVVIYISPSQKSNFIRTRKKSENVVCRMGNILIGLIVLNAQFLFDWFCLTHCGLETPYGDMELGQHWLK